MNKYVVVWDCETTGLNSKEDFIIQLACIKFEKDGGNVLEEKSWYIKPAHDFTISPKAQEVHGLSKDFILENGKYFKDISSEFFNMISDADLLTYNGNSFDIKFLNEECKRWGLDLPISNKMFYDAFAMECRFSPRDLSSVYKTYTGKDLEGAHDALNDVRATKDVFLAQMKQRGLTYDDINEFQENKLLTPDGTIRNSASPGEDMRIVFNVGKYKDSEFMDVAKKDPSYIKWYMENLASHYAKNILKEYYSKHR